MSSDELQTLLQVYLAQYTMYATLFLAGAVGALTILQVYHSTKRGRPVFFIGYSVFAAVALFAVWRLLVYTRGIDILTDRLGASSLDAEIRANDGFAYSAFRWVDQNIGWVIPIVMIFGIIMFACLLFLVDRSNRERKQASTCAS